MLQHIIKNIIVQVSWLFCGRISSAYLQNLLNLVSHFELYV